MPGTTQNNPDNSLTPELTSLETAERLMLTQVPRWQEVLQNKHPTCGEEVIFLSLLASLDHLAATRRGIQPWSHHESADNLLEETIEELLDGFITAEQGEAAIREHHLLGWFIQAFHATRREQSFAAHTKKEAKHSSTFTSTQLYTPKWCADFMAHVSITSLSTDRAPQVCDPCVGGGQMLLAALDVLARKHPELGALELANLLHGVDLDERAIEATRRSVFARIQELRDVQNTDALRALLSTHIIQGDGLIAQDETFDVVLTNPPYMGTRSMPPSLKQHLSKAWRPFHHDLYLAFMRRAFDLAPGGRVGLLTQQTVWFLSRFQNAREALLERAHLTHFVHLGHGAFAALSGEKANVVITLHEVSEPETSPSCEFFDLRACGESERRATLLAWLAEDKEETSRSQPLDSFSALPGKPLAHWLEPTWRALFKGDGPRLEDLADVPGSQNKTGRNKTYIKTWSDVAGEELGSAKLLAGDIAPDEARWIFYSKGGKYAPWWGNWTQVIDWSPTARDFYKTNHTSNLLDKRYWFRQGICYTDFGGRLFNARWMPEGCLFDMAGPAIFVDGLSPEAERRRLMALLAVLNTSPTRSMLNALNPSLHYQVRDVRNLPLPDWTDELEEALADHAEVIVGCMRALHLLVEKDPLFDASLQTDHRGEALERARRLASVVAEHWAAIEALVCEAHDVPQLAQPLPNELHHIMSRLERNPE